MGDERDTLTVGEAARRLGVSPSTIRNYIDKGYCTAFRVPGGWRRIPRADVERLLADYFQFAPGVVSGWPDTDGEQDG